jgi:DNA-binding NarL/FixJ family response regulator
MTHETTPRVVRVLLVDDQASVRRGIRAYLEALDIEVAAEAGDGQEALEVLEALDECEQLPHVVLLDLLMPRMDGVTATARVTRRHPAVRVVILTGFGQQDRVQAALANGADRCLLKDCSPAEVAEAIHAAASRPISENPVA